MMVYTALRWCSEECQETPEVALFKSITEAVDWLFDFHGGEEDDQSPLREKLYAFRRVSLDHCINLQVLPLTVKREDDR